MLPYAAPDPARNPARAPTVHTPGHGAVSPCSVRADAGLWLRQRPPVAVKASSEAPQAPAPKALHVSDSNFGPPPGNFNDDDSGSPRRGDTVALPPARRPLVTALVVAGALVVVIAIVAQFWTEVLWYQSVNFTGVFTTKIVTKVFLGVLGGVLTAAMVMSSIHVAF